MQPDERYVKAADEEPTVSSQNASVANASCSPALEPSGMIMPRLAAARGSRSPSASGTIAIDKPARIDILMCQLSSRCCSSDANGTIANCPIEPPAVATPTTLLGRRLPADGAQARPEPGRRHANPTDHFAERQNEARGRERGHETCRRRKEDRRWRPYGAVPKRSAMSPRKGENAPISSIASALANDHSSRPILRSAAIGF